MPWADLTSQVNTNGEILAPGFALDLHAGSFTGLSFTAFTYPGLKELLEANPHLLDDLECEDVAFKFHITASATPMTRDEFVGYQTTQALRLRDSILADTSASQALRDLKLSRQTVFEAFNIYVPFGDCSFDPAFIDAPPPNLFQFFAAPGQSTRLATINGPLAFATGITQSHANIGPMAILTLPDSSVIASGGLNRGSLFKFGPQGGAAGDPIVTLPFPIFDLARDPQGRIWAATGGGPLLQLDPVTFQIVGQFGDLVTQTLAVHPVTGEIYVSSGAGIEIFNPLTNKFRHYSDLRVGNMAFSPAGELWAAVWPQRGDIVRFDNKAKPHVMLHFAAPVDSIAFGLPGTQLQGLLFVSNNAGSTRLLPTELVMVDLATLHTIAVARGGSRGDIVKTNARGQVLLSQSHQIDVLSPVVAPRVVGTNPPDNALIALPLTSISVTYDRDMLAGDSANAHSVTNPANYRLIGDGSGPVTITSVTYDPATRTVILNFENPLADHYTLKVLAAVQSEAGLPLDADFVSDFTAVSDFSSIVNIELLTSRSDRATGTVSYDVRVTNITDHDLVTPLLLVLDPAKYFAGSPLGADHYLNADRQGSGRPTLPLSGCRQRSRWRQPHLFPLPSPRWDDHQSRHGPHQLDAHRHQPRAGAGDSARLRFARRTCHPGIFHRRHRRQPRARHRARAYWLWPESGRSVGCGHSKQQCWRFHAQRVAKTN